MKKKLLAIMSLGIFALGFSASAFSLGDTDYCKLSCKKKCGGYNTCYYTCVNTNC